MPALGFQRRSDRDHATSEDEGSDPHIHERGTPVLDFAEAAREYSKVDGKYGNACNDHHGPAVVSDKGLDRKAAKACWLLLIFSRRANSSLTSWGGRCCEEYEGCREEQEDVEQPCRAGIDGCRKESSAAIDEKVKKNSMGLVRRKGTVARLEDRPEENSELLSGPLAHVCNWRLGKRAGVLAWRGIRC